MLGCFGCGFSGFVIYSVIGVYGCLQGGWVCVLGWDLLMVRIVLIDWFVIN